MSKIEELIKKLCPNGVKYKKLGDVLDYIQPTKYIVKSTRYDNEFNIPVLTPGQTYILGYTNETDGIYKASKENPIILFDDFTTAFRWVDFEFKVKSSAVKILELKNNKDNFKYIYYAMQCIKYIPSQHARHWISTYSKISIPIPPREVQNEIVRILDNFTELEAELEAELVARKKQYEYFQNKLIRDNNFKTNNLNKLMDKLNYDKIDYQTIGKIANYRRGSFPQPYTNQEFYGGKGAMPFVQVADIEDNNFELKNKTKQTISKLAQPKSIFVPKGTVICSIQGTIGRVAITQYDAYVDRTIAIFESYKININKKYFAYCIQLKFSKEKKFARGSTLKTITKEEFTKFKIPVLPLKTQDEIVRILDNFIEVEEKINLEVEARRKQYEYYRDKLLDFKELKVEK